MEIHPLSCGMGAERNRLSVTLDDLDPYRGLHEPLPPERLEAAEVGTWRRLLGERFELQSVRVDEGAVGCLLVVPRSESGA